MKLLSAAIFSLIFVACLAGPPGPAGKNGSDLIDKDSLIVDLKTIAEFYLRNNPQRDSTFELSVTESENYLKSDTAMFNIYSVYEFGTGVFVQAKYTPSNWESLVEIEGVFETVNSLEVPPSQWLARWKENTTGNYHYFVAPTQLFNPYKIDYAYNYFFPNKGFMVSKDLFERGRIYTGKLKIYYW